MTHLVVVLPFLLLLLLTSWCRTETLASDAVCLESAEGSVSPPDPLRFTEFGYFQDKLSISGFWTFDQNHL